jgi:hypothetical protein
MFVPFPKPRENTPATLRGTSRGAVVLACAYGVRNPLVHSARPQGIDQRSTIEMLPTAEPVKFELSVRRPTPVRFDAYFSLPTE